MKSFLKPKYITHPVNGAELKFFPMTLSLVIRLRAVGEPVIRMMSLLQEKLLTKRNLYGQSFVDTSDAGGFRRIENSLQPISPEIFDRQRQEATTTVEQIITTVFNSETPMLLTEVCVDSLREEFPERGPSGKVGQEHIEEVHSTLDIGTLSQMLIGVGRANRKALGPFGDKLSQMWAASREPDKTASSPSGEPSSSAPSNSPESIKTPSPESEDNSPGPAPLRPVLRESEET